MTALPTSDQLQLDLICDTCGHGLTGINSTMRDWTVVWTLVTGHGWSGSPRPIGPHRCPQCTSESTTPTDDGIGHPASAGDPDVLWPADGTAVQ